MTAQNQQSWHELVSLGYLDTLPFSELTAQKLKEEIEKCLEKVREKYREFKKNPQKNFSSVCLPLEQNEYSLGVLTSTFFNLFNACSDDNFIKISGEVAQKLSQFQNDILLDEEIFTSLKQVWEKEKTNSSLGPQEKRLLEKQYKSFLRNGALLEGAQKEQLREIDSRLSQLSVDFGNNVLEDTKNFCDFFKEKSALEGIPELELEQAQNLAVQKGRIGEYAFNLEAPSYLSIVTYAKDRELRQRFFRAYMARGRSENHNNFPVIVEIIMLRAKRAKLLGYKNHAHYVLEERMAKTSEEVLTFIETLREKSLFLAKKEIQELEKFAKDHSPELEQLMPWDYSYYTEKFKNLHFQVSSQEVREYFPLEKVLEGLFAIAFKIYGLEFLVSSQESYTSDVRTFEVFKEFKGEKKFLGYLMLDLFSRSNKRAGAWMTSFRGQYFLETQEVRPIISIVTNFPSPTSQTPCLLSFNDFTTLFHEFGHALHGLCAEGKFESLSGTNVLWDFVELPSQLMENWCYQRECLNLCSSHYQTGKTIPDHLIQKLIGLRKFHEARMTLRQLHFAHLDLEWHTLEADSFSFSENKDSNSFIKEREEKLENIYRILPKVSDIFVSNSFSHIFAGGYSAGYYSYKWAEVLEADVFESFLEKGIFNREVGEKFYSCILSQGNTQDPMDLFIAFKERRPSITPLLKRAGL